LSAVEPFPSRTTLNVMGVQTPAPSQIWLVPQVVSAGRLGVDGTPVVHMSPVQTLPSTGTSLLSICVNWLPKPSHRFCWQSPATCVAVGPAGALIAPHTPAVQVRVRQAVSGPQSLGVMHSTHAPAPSQIFAGAQGVRAGA